MGIVITNETEGVNLSASFYICRRSKLFCMRWKHYSLIYNDLSGATTYNYHRLKFRVYRLS